MGDVQGVEDYVRIPAFPAAPHSHSVCLGPQGSCSLGFEVLWRICCMDIIDQIIGLLFSLKA